MQVIVLGGMGRVGKTDVADWIVEAAEEDGMNPVRLSFADPLKKQAAADAGYGDDWRKYKAEKPEDYHILVKGSRVMELEEILKFLV